MVQRTRAFVISPIGGFGPDGRPDQRRSYADRIFSALVGPAFERLKAEGREFKIERGDHQQEANVWNAILDGISDYDVVLALLSEHDPKVYNPNVFIEVGLAMAIGRGLITIKHQSQETPYDIKQALRHIEYTDSDLERPSVTNDAKVAEIAAKIQERLAPEKQFDEPLSRRNFYGRRGARDRFNHFDFKELSDLLLSADREIWLLGTSLTQLIDPANKNFFLPDPKTGDLTVSVNLATLLIYQMGAGVTVTALLCDETHPMLDFISVEDAGAAPAEIAAGRRQVRENVATGYNLWNDVKGLARLPLQVVPLPERPDVAPGELRVRKIKRGAVYQRVILTDKRVIVTPNFLHTKINSGPCTDARVGTEWHKWWRAELDYLYGLNDDTASDAKRGGRFNLWSRQR